MAGGLLEQSIIFQYAYSLLQSASVVGDGDSHRGHTLLGECALNIVTHRNHVHLAQMDARFHAFFHALYDATSMHTLADTSHTSAHR